MNNHITAILPEIFSATDRPHKTCPGYDHWLADQVWKKAQQHFADKCCAKCSSVIMTDLDFDGASQDWLVLYE